MAKKSYSTTQQRLLLESAGVPHEPGRSREEADNLIQQCIETGRLPRNSLSPATEKQLAFMEKLAIPCRADLTKEEASELIDKQIEANDKVTPISQKQFDFVQQLGGVPSKRMTRYQAGQFIDILIDNQVRCNKCNSTYDRRRNRCEHCAAFVPRLAPLRPPLWIYKPTMIEQILSWFGL